MLSMLSDSLTVLLASCLRLSSRLVTSQSDITHPRPPFNHPNLVDPKVLITHNNPACGLPPVDTANWCIHVEFMHVRMRVCVCVQISALSCVCLCVYMYAGNNIKK